MIEGQTLYARVVQTMDAQIVERGGQHDVAVRAGKGDVGRPAQGLAHPVVDEQLDPPALQIKDVDRIRTVAGDPQPAVCIERYSIRYVPGHVDHTLKGTGRSIRVDGDAGDGTAEGLHKIEVQLIGVQNDGIGGIHRFWVPEHCLAAAGFDLVDVAIYFTGPIAAVGEVHITLTIEGGVVGAGKGTPIWTRGVGADLALGVNLQHLARHAFGTVEVAVCIHGLTETAVVSPGELLGCVGLQIDTIYLAACSGGVDFAFGADGDGLRMVDAADVDDLVLVVGFDHGQLPSSSSG